MARTPEEIREYKRQWRLRNLDRLRDRDRAYRVANAEVVKSRKAEEQRRNREAYNARHKRWRDNIRAEMVEAYGAMCACCNEAQREFLTLDHVNGGGSEDRRRLGTNSTIRILRELQLAGWPKDRFRLLCWNCQFGVMQPGGCPHQTGSRDAAQDS